MNPVLFIISTPSGRFLVTENELAQFENKMLGIGLTKEALAVFNPMKIKDITTTVQALAVLVTRT